jgi:hypothetical protein
MKRTNINLFSTCKTIYACAAIAVFLVLNGNSALAQDGGDGGGTQAQLDALANLGTGNTNAGNGASASAGGDAVDFTDSAQLDLGGSTDDNRNQGFVGATAPAVAERNFVGSASQTFGALGTTPNGETATFGGGVNDSSNLSIPSSSAGGGGQGGFGGANNTGTSGVSVIRQNLRAHLRPAFSSPTVNPLYTAQQFTSNLSRQPGTENLQGRYQVYIQNKTATLIGSVQTQADADRIVRQLRLQPGVYHIENQLSVQQQ